jgi:hypothetical protein
MEKVQIKTNSETFIRKTIAIGENVLISEITRISKSSRRGLSFLCRQR